MRQFWLKHFGPAVSNAFGVRHFASRRGAIAGDRPNGDSDDAKSAMANHLPPFSGHTRFWWSEQCRSLFIIYQGSLEFPVERFLNEKKRGGEKIVADEFR